MTFNLGENSYHPPNVRMLLTLGTLRGHIGLRTQHSRGVLRGIGIWWHDILELYGGFYKCGETNVYPKYCNPPDGLSPVSPNKQCLYTPLSLALNPHPGTLDTKERLLRGRALNPKPGRPQQVPRSLLWAAVGPHTGHALGLRSRI